MFRRVSWKSVSIPVKSDLDKMSAHIDLKTPKLRPWDDAQLGEITGPFK